MLGQTSQYPADADPGDAAWHRMRAAHADTRANLAAEREAEIMAAIESAPSGADGQPSDELRRLVEVEWPAEQQRQHGERRRLEAERDARRAHLRRHHATPARAATATPPRTARQRGAGRPAAQASSSSSSRGGDSGDSDGSGSSSGDGDPPGAQPSLVRLSRPFSRPWRPAWLAERQATLDRIGGRQ